MDIAIFLELIGTVGFPIACVIVLGIFVFKIYKDTQVNNKEALAENKETIVKIQAESKAREEKLYSFLEDSTAVNAKFAEIIARYETKLDEIKADVKEIKTDIIEIKA